ncbi:MAG: glycogen-binding domain-containing protein, partial [Bacteroidetes bacterium]|nr:glycogen-binding domain-containing protein [Bacteroidota bacterium]
MHVFKTLTLGMFMLLIYPMDAYAQSGCTNPLACNFSSSATSNDGSCTFLTGEAIPIGLEHVWHVGLFLEGTAYEDLAQPCEDNGTVNPNLSLTSNLVGDGSSPLGLVNIEDPTGLLTALAGLAATVEFGICGEDISVKVLGQYFDMIQQGEMYVSPIPVGPGGEYLWAAPRSSFGLGCSDEEASNYTGPCDVDIDCLYDVTFQVNMAGQTVSADGLYVTGSFNGWNLIGQPMVLIDYDMYRATVSLPLGDYEYKFVNGTSWSAAEHAPYACAAEFSTNRFFSLTNGSLDLGTPCFGSCSACSGCTDPAYGEYDPYATSNAEACQTIVHPVTFTVDASQTSFSEVYLAGGFNGWSESDHPMQDLNGDGVYVLTVSLPEGWNEFKFVGDGDWSLAETFDGSESCTTAPGGIVNRTIQVLSSMILDEVCYNSCVACPVVGCMDSSACNFDPLAVQDDGSCETYDCLGVCGGSAVVDACGVCNGPGSIYACGCSGIPSGDCDCNGNQLDALGICGGSCATDADSDGICDDVDPCVGSLDACGVCNGPGSIYDCGCSGIPSGDCDCNGNQLDALGICGGGCAADADSDGICDDADPCVGSLDACGVCNGPGPIYDCGCSGVPAGDCDCNGNQFDVVGVCGGSCTADADSDGICDDVDPCVGALDACGVCNGIGAQFQCGCSNIPSGDCDCNGNQLDALGICGGGCAADADSDGICDDVDPCVGSLDACGVCNGPGPIYACGCSGIPSGDCDCNGNQLDALGICGGGCAADADSDGICDDVDDCVGALDACGVCNGIGAQFQCGCSNIPSGDCDCNGNQLDALGICGGGCAADADSD